MQLGSKCQKRKIKQAIRLSHVCSFDKNALNNNMCQMNESIFQLQKIGMQNLSQQLGGMSSMDQWARINEV